MNAGWSTSVTHNNYHCVPRRINFQSARGRKESQRAGMTDGAVCQWHTFGTDRSGALTNDADGNLDK
jgi:hypothetical protein